MKLLISQKRYHPNSIPIVQILKENRVTLRMFAYQSSLDEDYSDLTPTYIGYNKFIYQFLSFFLSKDTVIKFAFPKIFTLFKELKTYKPDIIILKKYRVPNMVLFILARIFTKSKIAILTDFPIDKKLSRKIFLLRKLALYPSYIIHTTKEGSSEFHRIIDNNFKRLFQPYPVSVPARNDEKVQEEKVKILFVGKFMSERKRPDWILLAVDRLKLREKVYIHLVGLGSEDDKQVIKLKQLVQKLNLGSCVKFQFNVPHNLMSDVYKKSDVLILPAKNEPFGMVVVEALANGMPLLVSDTCGSKNAVRDGLNGYIFKTDDFDDFVNKLDMITSDRERIINMSRHSDLHAIEYYTKDKWFKTINEFLGLKELDQNDS